MTARLAIALLFIVPAALAYPWQTVTQRWIIGVAVAVVIILFAWWRGEFATTKLARRWAIWRGNHRKKRPAEAGTSATALLRVDAADQEHLPVALIAGYVDRYGLRCDKVRITSHDSSGARENWVSLTLNAATNLPALQARSPQIPLQDTVDVVARRLADHLREDGWDVTVTDDGQRPEPVSEQAKESWRALRDGAGFLAVYRITVTSLPETLAEVWAQSSTETWTAVEFGPDTVAAVCALRSGDKPARSVPVTGLRPLGGRQRSVLDALDPLSVRRLEGHEPADPELAVRLRWPAAISVST